MPDSQKTKFSYISRLMRSCGEIEDGFKKYHVGYAILYGR